MNAPNASAGRFVVSVIVPCRNEAGYVEAFVASVLAQQLPPQCTELEVLIADGRSDDGTLALLEGLMARHSGLRVVDNPGRIVSTGLNAALAQARGEVIVRMDVHTRYASDYIAQCVAVLAETGATCVGGAWLPQGQGWPQAAIATAFQSRFGSGGAASRRPDLSGWVDTVYLGCWRRDELLRLGGFDESLVRNQDDELNLRIHRQGGRVWQSAHIRSWYSPRASFVALVRQFFQYGYWKVPVIRKHRLPASVRHVVPFAFVATVLVLAALAVFSGAAAWALAGLLAVYGAAAAFSAAALVSPWARPADFAAVVGSFVCMHAGYGAGFGLALFESVVRRRGPSDVATRLTR